MKEKFRHFARQMKSHVKALHLASRDHRTPMSAKCLVILVVAYALSPIDLIPDFIPVLGYLDDLILLPLGIYLAINLIPEDLWREFQTQAEQINNPLPNNHGATLVIGMIWCVGIAAAGFVLWRVFLGRYD